MFRKFAILCYIIMEKQDFFRKGADFMTAKNPKKAAPFAELTLLNRNHTEYPDTPDKAKIETFQNANAHRNYLIEFDCPEFTSLCPVTGQPDFGHIVIRYVADQRCIESKALKLYLFSYRNFNNWTYIYTSKTVIDKNPTEIRITYTQDNNFEDGFYAFFIYDQNNKQLVGQEFHVKNKPVDTVTGNTPDTSDATDTTDATTETT